MQYTCLQELWDLGPNPPEIVTKSQRAVAALAWLQPLHHRRVLGLLHASMPPASASLLAASWTASAALCSPQQIWSSWALTAYSVCQGASEQLWAPSCGLLKSNDNNFRKPPRAAQGPTFLEAPAISLQLPSKCVPSVTGDLNISAHLQSALPLLQLHLQSLQAGVPLLQQFAQFGQLPGCLVCLGLQAEAGVGSHSSRSQGLMQQRHACECRKL